MNGNATDLQMNKIHRELLVIRFICLTLMAVCLGETAFLILQNSRRHRSIRAEELVIENTHGKVVARLGSGSVNTCLEIAGETKQAATTLCVGDRNGSSLHLSSHKGDSIVALSSGGIISESVGQSVSPYLVLTENGKSAITATVGVVPNPLLGEGSSMNGVDISVPENGASTISIVDPGRKSIWSTASGH